MSEFLKMKQYLDANMIDPIPRYIYLREIEGKKETDDICMKLHEEIKECKWYRQLEDEMLEDGSYGRFHTVDTKIRQKEYLKQQKKQYAV